MRRSAARWLSPFIAAAVVANVLLLDSNVLHEMVWSVYSAHFATVLLAPLVAAIGAIDGVRMSAGKEVVEARGSTTTFLVASWAATMAWTTLGYIVGLVGVVGAVRAFGTPSWPSIALLATALPALAFLGVAAAAGLAAGWHTARYLTAGLVAVTVFAVTIVGYIVEPTLVRVGGATASLVSLEPDPAVGLGQIIFYLILTSFMILGVTLRGTPRIVAAVGLALALVAVGVPLASAPATLRLVSPAVVCEGSTPEICLTAEYEVYREDLRREVDALVVRLKMPEWAIPVRLTQDATNVSLRVGFLPALHKLLRDPSAPIVGGTTNAYLDGCPEAFDDALFPDTVRVMQWIRQAYSGVPEGEEAVLFDDAVVSLRRLVECAA